MKSTWIFFRVLFVELTGWVLLLGGIVLMPLPGPGSLLAFSGIVVLSTRYAWARRLRRRARRSVEEATRQSVATRKRIGLSVLAGLVAFLVGLALFLDPVLPSWIDFDFMGIFVGPHIPYATPLSGILAMSGALVALALLAYAAVKYREKGSLIPVVEEEAEDLAAGKP